MKAIIQEFGEHPIVAIGDAHDCAQQYQFLRELISDSGFAGSLNDIVVEFGNSLYQDTMDRYLSGEDISSEQFSLVWRNTTQIIVWDSPVYEEFFAEVRRLNQQLPRGRRLRVILGDPPIDWSQVQSSREWGHWLSRRDEYFAEVVKREVLAKHRKALLIVGGAHLVRNLDKSNVTALIEADYPKSMYIVMTHDGFTQDDEKLEGRMKHIRVGSLLSLQATWLGALPPSLRWPQMKDAKILGTRTLARIQDVADAWLYVGLRPDLIEALPFPGIYRDDYWNELNRRSKIMSGKPLSAEDFNLAAHWVD